MAPADHAAPSGPVYRIDRFNVPKAGRTEFLGRVRQTHEMLRRQNGYVRALIVEQRCGPAASNIVTLVEWLDEAVVPHVRAAVVDFHASIRFDPAQMIERLGIGADFGLYDDIGREVSAS